MENELIKPFIVEEENKKIKPFTIVEKDKPIPPEERIYVLLYYAEIENEEEKSFEVLKGREEMYNFIKNFLEDTYMDIHKSRVLVTGVTYEEADSVYIFMKHMENFFIDGFDIEDYNIGDM